MTIERPGSTLGMRHVALQVANLERCEHFYVELLGMTVEWRPDDDNVYLTGGADNLALHRIPSNPPVDAVQFLDHIGFIVATPVEVDDWHAFLVSHDVEIIKAPKTHRDGARSFYCRDPAGVVVQLIYHPPLSDG